MAGALALFAGLMVLGSAVCRRDPGRVRFHRKSIHAAMALASLAFPAWIGSTGQVLVLAAGFVAALAVFRLPALGRRGFVNVLSNPAGHPDGEFWFVAGIAAALLLARDDPFAFAGAVLTLGLADPAAAGIGRRWGRLRVSRHPRTLEGSAAFFVTALLSLAGAAALSGQVVPFPALLGLALAGTLAEGFSPFGSDNLFVPLVVAWLALGV